MFLRKLLFNHFKNQVHKKWQSITIPDELKNEFSNLEEQITLCFAKTTHWHGTGRYHYDTQGNSKYSNQLSNKTIDVLAQIITDNGLKPHDDPWVITNMKYTSTISTTEWRMYARVYAELHSSEKYPILYTFGARKDIVNFFLYYTLLSSPPIAYYKGLGAAFSKKRFGNKGPIWAKTINNSIESKGNAFTDLLDILGECTSNINENYGILFGINALKLKYAQINPIIAMFETRFTELVSFDHITHIEVPLRKVSEIKALLNEHAIEIPVLPIELCEMYAANLPIQFSAQNNELPQFPYDKLVTHYKGTETIRHP